MDYSLSLNNSASFLQSSSVSIPTGGVAGTSSAISVAKQASDVNSFQALLERIQAENAVSEEKTNGGSFSSSSVIESGRLNGDYTTPIAGSFNNPADKNAKAVGAAVNGAGAHGFASNATIDKTSKLYEAALELESYFVKVMLSSMRSTINKTNLSGEEQSYAQSMYEDMLYDEYACAMTRSAGFGLADQIYLQMSAKA